MTEELTNEELLEAAEKVAAEWELFKSMSIYQRIMDAAISREEDASNALINYGTPENVEKLRADIIKARDMQEWFMNMEQVYEQFEFPDRYEPNHELEFTD